MSSTTHIKEFAEWMTSSLADITRNDKKLTIQEIVDLSLKELIEQCQIVIHNGNIMPTTLKDGKALLGNPSEPLYSIDYRDDLKANDLLIGLPYGY